ncbi:MAG: response regulator transcription factor [Ignavibacteriae bacterium]|nr:response regulator transcription factor [Ignavibacteriota bacterium]
MKKRVLLADDHAIIRDGLKSLLINELKMEVIGLVEDGVQAVQLARTHQPDLVIIDMNMPHKNGLEATREILDENPEIKVIALSMHSDKRYIMEMLSIGASGYILKESAFKEVAQAIETVLNGRTYISPQVGGDVIKECLGRLHMTTPEAFSPLTPKEREVLKLIAEGKHTKEIAEILFLSVKTVEVHRQHIMDKLKLHSVAELTKYAIREGLTSLE